ncbi:V-type ATP synthase subunit D [Candidatus Wolfebacteria bacterium]|nr:MAG: V-type ATP synthase subunit D [Candidatus Wolfebacteria bacterium]
MILKVNPTRINFLNLKRELKMANRGHKLLKDKRDGLMKKFMEVISEVKDLRIEVESGLAKVFKSYTRASTMMRRKSIASAFMLPNATIEIEATEKTLMSVPIPTFNLKKEGSLFSYGFLETSGDLDSAVMSLDEVFPSLIKLAEREKVVENMAVEIEKTRRRASALENTMIPNLKETIRFISGRLEEQARDAVVSTMRIKAMIIAKEDALGK